MEKKIPITRIGKFFGVNDFELDISMGEEWVSGDMNFKVVLYRVDKQKTKKDNVYGEVMENEIVFLAPIEINSIVKIELPSQRTLGNSLINNNEPGNLIFHVYSHVLNDLGVEISLGDYIGYYEREDFVRYYSIVNDGRITSDNKHSYGGYKNFYKTFIAAPVMKNEFNGK